MTEIENALSAHVFVGIDISKHRHEVLIAAPGKQRRRRVALTNTKADFERLVAILSGYALPVRIGFEATGNCHRALVHHLSCAGFELKLVSSVALARTREALHNSWDKNDPKDAQVILHLLEIGAVQIVHDPLVAGVNDIQELSKTHEIVSRAKTELWHRLLTHYLPLYFPEADRYHRSSRTDRFLAFLEAFPSPHFIAAMGRKASSRRHGPSSGGAVSQTDLLSDIYETAKTSVGRPVDPDSDALRMFQMVLAEGRSLIRQRNEIEARSPVDGAPVRFGRLPTADIDPWHWAHQRHDHFFRSRRSAVGSGAECGCAAQNPRRERLIQRRLRAVSLQPSLGSGTSI